MFRGAGGTPGRDESNTADSRANYLCELFDGLMNNDFDLAIIGSGFSASLLAMIARRVGLSVILIERGSHPRFAIGESTSPLMNLIIEQLARRYDLPRLLPLTTFGAWQRHYPDVVCGL